MKKVWLALAFAALAFCAHSQSAEKISEIIEGDEISYEQAAWLAYSYAQEDGESASYEQALQAVIDKGWIASGAVAQNPISLKNLCGVFAKASGLKCGLFYRISKADRYAFKELKANGTLDSAADPSMTVSGQNAVSILNACAKKAGGSK